MECHLSMNEVSALNENVSLYSFRSLIAICHNIFVNCDAINVGYQFSWIEKKFGCYELW